MVELDELLFRWQQGENISQLSRSLGQSRQTVRAYLKRAEHLGFSRDADDTRRAEVVRAMLRKAPAAASPARDELTPWLTGGALMHLIAALSAPGCLFSFVVIPR